ARGEWVGIVESDDECEPEMFNSLLAESRKGDADIVKAGFSEIDENGRITNRGNVRFHPCADGAIFQPREAPDLYVIHQSAWTALYRREFLQHHRIHFPECRGGYQDAGFTFAAYLADPRIRWMEQSLYRYRRFRVGNTMVQRGWIDAAVDVLRHISELICRCSNTGNNAIAPAIRGVLSIMVWHYLRLDDEFLVDFTEANHIIIGILLRCVPDGWADALKICRFDVLRYPVIKSLVSGKDVDILRSVHRIRRIKRMSDKIYGFRALIKGLK
ncbi:MAG: hypothetical protein KAJ98_02395, partial [Spirochaetaceae bacterium]|nr:hypothetical protein [Spirochaetaceae bacterium]